MLEISKKDYLGNIIGFNSMIEDILLLDTYETNVSYVNESMKILSFGNLSLGLVSPKEGFGFSKKDGVAVIDIPLLKTNVSKKDALVFGIKKFKSIVLNSEDNDTFMSDLFHEYVHFRDNVGNFNLTSDTRKIETIEDMLSNEYEFKAVLYEIHMNCESYDESFIKELLSDAAFNDAYKKITVGGKDV